MWGACPTPLSATQDTDCQSVPYRYSYIEHRHREVHIGDKIHSMDGQQVIQHAIDQKLIRFVPRSCFWVCVQGAYGSKFHIFQIKEDLKAARFRYSKDLGWHRRRKGYYASRRGIEHRRNNDW